MNSVQLLNLLLKSLRAFEPQEPSDLGSLANDIDSIRGSLISTSAAFNQSAQQLWEALEIIGVTHQENGVPLTSGEKEDLGRLVTSMIEVTIREIDQQSPTPD